MHMFEIGGPKGNFIIKPDGTREKFDSNKPKANNLWPVTIITARYQGGYEGGKWLAFNCDYDDVPEAVYGSDMECFDFFEEYNRSNKKKNPLKIGRGNTPDEALKDLVSTYYGS